jgi:hypothetical protein
MDNAGANNRQLDCRKAHQFDEPGPPVGKEHVCVPQQRLEPRHLIGTVNVDDGRPHADIGGVVVEIHLEVVGTPNVQDIGAVIGERPPEA